MGIQESIKYYKGNLWYLLGGSKLTLPYKGLPTIALRVNNLLGQNFSEKNLVPVPRSWDMGFSLTPYLVNRTRLHLELDIRDIAASPRLQGGLELDLSRKIFFRMGHGDYSSLGLGLRTPKVDYDLVVYAKKVPRGFRKRDYRFTFSLSTGL